MNAFINKLCINAMLAKQNLKRKLTEERGEANIIAIIMILVIVIGLVILFKDAITELAGDIIERFTSDGNSILDPKKPE